MTDAAPEPYAIWLTRSAIRPVLDGADPSGLISWIRTLAAGRGLLDPASDMASPPLQMLLRSQGAPAGRLTTQGLLESLAAASLASIAIALALGPLPHVAQPDRPASALHHHN
jgi:hypothetical protein